MCELLGMSANVPTDICFSFSGLMQRGGATGPHKDGWGIAFYEDRGCRAFHDPTPSANSPLAQLVSQWPIKSDVVISHIRQANVGRVSLENTQPYQRELWGRPWTVAHNGQIPEVLTWQLGGFTPIGTSDSEHAACWLLGQLRLVFVNRPSTAELAHFFKSRCDELAKLGVFNLLASDGDELICYCTTKLHWITRRAPFGEAKLSDADLQIDFGTETTPNDVVSVVATQPLTSNEVWHALAPNQLVVFKHGELVFQSQN
ncbi:MAG: class II glutamine amidotransferase [Gammaproteobacteria bacterium]|nr:class II glutamine amidotransferase [Gammaproteobacteria bacterium]